MRKQLFLLTFLLQRLSARAKTVDLGSNPRGLTERNITIDFESCNMDDYTYEEYIDKDNDEGCHKIHMTNKTIQEKYGSSIRSCCAFHGYLANGACDGTDDKVVYRV